MNRIVALLLVILTLVCLVSCGKNQEEHSLYGCYTFGDDPNMFMNFQLTLLEDGRFSYYASPLSSYIGAGEYVIEGDIITLTDDGGYDFVNRFRMEEGKLIFIEEGSSNFLYAKLKDVDAFEYAGNFRGTGYYDDE